MHRRTYWRVSHTCVAIFACSAISLMSTSIRAQVFVESEGTIGEYSLSGSPINPSLITGLTSNGPIAVSGSNLFVASSTAISEYTTSGTEVSSDLISVPVPLCMAISGQDIFVGTNQDDVREYTTSGNLVNSSVAQGFTSPNGIAVSGGDVFVYDIAGEIDEYTTAGTPVAVPFKNVAPGYGSLAATGTELYYTSDNIVGGFGLMDSSSFSSGGLKTDVPGQPLGIAVDGSDLLVADLQTGNVEEFSNTGSLVNGAFIPALDMFSQFTSIAVEVPEPACLSFLTAGILLSMRRHRAPRRR